MKRLASILLACLLSVVAALPVSAHHPRGGSNGGITQQYKWNPGFGALTYAQPIGPGTAFTNYQTDLTTIDGDSATIKNYAVFVNWSGLESTTQGNWQFTGCSSVSLNPASRSGCGNTFVLDQIFNTAYAQGQRVVLVINPGVFNNGTPGAPSPTDNSIIPAYITNNTGTYGAGLYGSSGVTSTGASGFWVQASGGYGANLTNANVLSAFNAMIAELAAKFDGDPALEGIIFQAMDSNYPYAGTGATGSAFYTGWEGAVSAAKTAFQHTSVAEQVAFDETGDAQSENYTATLVGLGGFVSASDTYGETAFTNYQESSAGCTMTGGAFTGTPSGTSGTLASNWVCASSPDTYSGGSLYWPMQLSDSQVLSTTFTKGSTAVSWTPTITGSPTNSFNLTVAPFFVTQGMRAWMGISPNGSGYSLPGTPLQTGWNSWPLVEAGDMCAGGAIPNVYGFPVNYNPSDIVSAANATGISGYKASHVFFTLLDSSQCTTNANAVSAAMISTLSGLSLTNTAYPYSH